MKTAWLLMAEHESPTIPAEEVCKKYFAPLTYPVFLKKLGLGEIDLVVARMGDTQKSARIVHINDLANYIDRQREVAARELKALRA